MRVSGTSCWSSVITTRVEVTAIAGVAHASDAIAPPASANCLALFIAAYPLLSLAADIEQEARFACRAVGVGDDEPDGPFPRGAEIVGRNVGQRAARNRETRSDGAELGRLAPRADLEPRRSQPVGRDRAVDAHRRAVFALHNLDPGDRRLDVDRRIEIERRARIDEPRAREVVAPWCLDVL